MIVFDSSALLAIVFDEPGADLVNDLINDADVSNYLRTVNAAELLNKAARRFDMREALALFERLGVVVRHDMDAAFIADVAALKTDHNMALGDCFGVALARRLDAEFVTSDTPKWAALKTWRRAVSPSFDKANRNQQSHCKSTCA